MLGPEIWILSVKFQNSQIFYMFLSGKEFIYIVLIFTHEHMNSFEADIFSQICSPKAEDQTHNSYFDSLPPSEAASLVGRPDSQDGEKC